MTVRSALEIVTATDAGMVRSFNEDAIATELDLGLCVVADGMGGYKAGDVASAMAASIILEQLKRLTRADADASPVQMLHAAAAEANRAIFQVAQANPQYQGMGTTLVAALFRHNRLHFIHVGDARLYRLRHGKLTVLTRDHSILHEQVTQGLISAEDAKTSHNRNLVTRALGIGAEATCETQEQDVETGDLYLLCSDGLNDMVDDADIELALATLQVNLPLTARQLVMMANDNGGHDNISVILVRIREPFPLIEPGKGLMDRLFGWLK